MCPQDSVTLHSCGVFVCGCRPNSGRVETYQITQFLTGMGSGEKMGPNYLTDLTLSPHHYPLIVFRLSFLFIPSPVFIHTLSKMPLQNN